MTARVRADTPTQRARTPRASARSAKTHSPFAVLGLVTSAGGLRAVSEVLRELAPDLPVPVVVGQHLYRRGSRLVQLLGRVTSLEVSWATTGDRLAPGAVKICPADMRLEVRRDLTVSLTPIESFWRDRPLDSFLASLAATFGRRALAVVLTGMGDDGSNGAREVKLAGGTVLVQSEDTAEASSMPHAAIENGAADLVLPLDEIGEAIEQLLAGRRTARGGIGP